MRLFKEVLIETAEQAEALPATTLARNGSNVIVKGLDGRWWWAGLDGLVRPQSVAAIGWTALVPIEAEEEHAIWKSWDGSANGLGIPVPPDYPFHDLAPGEMVHRRLVTPWEEA